MYEVSEDSPFDEEAHVDAQGFPQLPLSDLARALRDFTNTPGPAHSVPVRAHYRRIGSKKAAAKKKKKKQKQATLKNWLKNAPPKQQKKKNPPILADQQENEDRDLAFRLRFLEIKELTTGSRR
jgi:hypothetical protein